MIRYQMVAVQSRDNEVNQAKNPATDNVPTSSEEVLEAVVDKDIYYKNELKLNDNNFNDSPPPLKTVADIQLDTLETYVQVKIIFASNSLYRCGLLDFVIICIFHSFFTIIV